MATFISSVICCITLIVSSALAGIYFPKRHYYFRIPSSIGGGDHIGTIFLLENDFTYCKPSDTKVTVEADDSAKMNVSATLSKDRIVLTAKDILGVVSGSNHFKVSVVCMDSASKLFFIYHNILWESEIVIEASRHSRGPAPTSQPRIDDILCPKPRELVYDIIENTPPGSMDTFEGYEHVKFDYHQEYEVNILLEDKSEFLDIEEDTSSLLLTQSLDQEDKPSSLRGQYLKCHISFQGKPIQDSPFTRHVIINIYDVNDNPPKKKGDLKFEDIIPVDENITDDLILRILDKDTTNVTNDMSYSVSSNDTKGVIQLGDMKYSGTAEEHTSITTWVRRVKDLRDVPLPYQVHVTIEDHFYKFLKDSRDKKVVYKLKFVGSEDEGAPLEVQETNSKVDVNILAAKYALITKLKNSYATSGGSTEWAVVQVIPPQFMKVVGVTQEGHVFVLDEQTLSSYTGSMNPLVKISLSVQGVRRQVFSLALMLTDNGHSRGNDICHQGCSVHQTQESCTSSCGYGAPSGKCSWDVSMTSCTPDPTSCPDRICSALEKIRSDICPQDCSWESKTPDTTKQTFALPPCVCPDENGAQCKCPTTENPNKAVSVDEQNGNGTLVHRPSSNSGCTAECQAGIGIAIFLVILVVVLFLVRRIFWKKCQEQRQLPSLKHVNSIVSMSAIPSDYVVDDLREARAHVTRQTLSHASGPWVMKNAGSHGTVDDAWEFPRQHLSLENIIGEGEFGQVMKATAKMADQGQGQVSDGTKVVAVKMLKPEASGTEYQDLLSEFQMLKEVSHPNVIQLLGVCTQKGPLYLIVEFCELGSLRSFLRASKYKNKISWEEKQRNGNMFADTRDIPEARTLTSRDLFSFAWQISKGMDYLAGLKIVHRDLAARNVLVKDGMQLKISDFGLSRDVYEANTYLKMSKGRIPVKWMAPESLYAQVYTTKSDTWSYGIVLWEVVTLGASPYPGVPPEKLYLLLSTGYRMDRPEDCPDEMYALMQKCWKSAPEDRPSFSVLRDILDHILQQNTDYLELPDSAIAGRFDDFSSLRRQVNGKKISSPTTSFSPATSSSRHHTSNDVTENKLLPAANSQPAYRNIRNNTNASDGSGSGSSISFGQYRLDRTTQPSSARSPSSSFSPCHNTPNQHKIIPHNSTPTTQTQWQHATAPTMDEVDESDRESVPESSKLLVGSNNKTSNKNPSKNLYQNNVNANANVIRPSNTILKTGHGTNNNSSKTTSSIVCPRQVVHENLTYV